MQKPQKANSLFLFTLLGITLIVTLLAAVPEFRERFRQTFRSETREVLAKAEADLTGQGDIISVIKVRKTNELALEIYSLNAKTGETFLRARLLLPERKDAHFEFHGRPTNLALADLNGDGILEILAPTFDENLIPRLHIYRYDPTAQVFILAGPEFLPIEGASPTR